MKETVKQQVLKIMEEHKGEAVSGEEIAKKLGVSRTAVSKAAASLKNEGYKIESKTKSGYVFSDDNDIYSSQSVSCFLKEDNIYIDIREELDSTNTQLKLLAQKGEKEGYVLIANKQVMGRGRRGHTFFSPSSGLYMSILLRPTISASDSLLITTAAAVAVSRAIEKVSDKKCEIKWVNDIYSEGRKLCGILTEASIDFEGGTLDYAVLGIGVNLSDPQGDFPKEIENIAGSLFGKREFTNKEKSILTAEILNEFFALYKDLSKKEYMKEYRARSFLIGKEVDIIISDKKIDEATVIDIDDDAHLIVRYKNGEEKALFSGDVSAKIQK